MNEERGQQDGEEIDHRHDQQSIAKGQQTQIAEREQHDQSHQGQIERRKNQTDRTRCINKSFFSCHFLYTLVISSVGQWECLTSHGILPPYGVQWDSPFD